MNTIKCDCGYPAAVIKSHDETDDNDLYLRTQFYVECPICGYMSDYYASESEAYMGALNDGLGEDS